MHFKFYTFYLEILFRYNNATFGSPCWISVLIHNPNGIYLNPPFDKNGPEQTYVS